MICRTLKYVLFASSALVTGLCLNACGNMTILDEETNASLVEGDVSGVSQKGPFASGSSVTLYEMDENLHQTGLHFETVIDNDSGKYNIKEVSINGPYAWMVVNGYFMNELTGKLSSRKISLNGLVSVEDGDNVNLNVLNHLAFNRINYLVQQGKSVAAAKKQAEGEVLKAFGFESDETSFDRMSIFSDGEGDAKLLAISLIMLYQQDEVLYSEAVEDMGTECRTEDECDLRYSLHEFVDDGGLVIDLMAQISYDIETDGTWDNDSLKKEMMKRVGLAGNNGIYARVEKNLKKMGARKIPDFEKYLKVFSPKDSLWGHCNRENEIVLFGQRSLMKGAKRICVNSQWKNYEGVRGLGIPPVDTDGQYGTVKDKRDGHVYNTIDVELADGETVTWMADLLEYEAVKTKKEKQAEYIEGVGRTYALHQILGLPDSTEDAVMDSVLASSGKIQGVCPAGWHIPSIAEWKSLKDAIKDDYETTELLLHSQYVDDGISVSFHFMRAQEYYPKYSSNFVIGNDVDQALNCDMLGDCRERRKDPSLECRDFEWCDEEYEELSSVRCVKD